MSPRRGPLRAPVIGSVQRTGTVIEITAPFLIDAIADGERGWAGRVRVDGHVLFLCASLSSQEQATQKARDALATHLQMLFTGATDVEHQQQTERYATLVEIEAAQVLRQAAGWRLITVQAQAGQYVAFFQREWQ